MLLNFTQSLKTTADTKTPNPHEWVIRTLEDIHDYAAQNHLIRLAAEIDVVIKRHLKHLS